MRINKGIKIDFEYPLRLMLFGMMLILFSEPLNIYSIISLGTYIILIACFVAVVFLFIKKRQALSILQIVLMIVVVLLSLISSDLTYRSVVVAICFMELPLFMIAYDEISRESTYKAVFLCYDCLSIYYLILSFSPLSNIYYTKYGEAEMPFLTLGYDNPNQTGMILFICFIILTYQLMHVKTIMTKIFLVIDLFCMFALICLTMSRAALLLSIVLITLTVIYRNKKLPKWLHLFAFVAPLAYTLISVFSRDLLSNWIIFGQPIETGRADIYNHVFEQINLLKLVFGDFSYQFQNLHNAYVSIFATTGILGLTAFILFMYSKYNYIYIMINTKKNKNVPFLGMIGIMLYSAVESAYFTTGSAFAASVLSVYVLCIFRKEGDEM